MHIYSNEFYLKFSNPKISSKPILRKFLRSPPYGLIELLSLKISQLNNLSYRVLDKESFFEIHT